MLFFLLCYILYFIFIPESDVYNFPVSPLSQDLFPDFDPRLSWDERQIAIKDLGMTAKEFVIGCERKKPALFASSNPESILANRRYIMEALIGHVTKEIQIEKPVFSGRNGASLLIDGSAPNLGYVDTIWATPIPIFRECIGGTMNNPFNYMFVKATKSGPDDLFVPMIAVYDSAELTLTPLNQYDGTSWKTDKDSVLESVAALYYFNPTQLQLTN